MVTTEEHVWQNADTPTKKKELYYDAEVHIRCHMLVAGEIRDRLGPGSARSELFRATCFGPWLDVRSTSNDTHLVHLMLQTQYIPPGIHNALYFHVGGRELRFGPEEFCLITGLRFVPHHRRQERPGRGVTFKERVFGRVQASLKVSHLKTVFNCSLDQLSDLDAVRVCLLMLLVVGFMGGQSKLVLDPTLLELVEDLDSWNSYPWGSYIWKVVYEQLHDALATRSARFASIPTTRHRRYSLHGFIWAFKIWIFEIFPYARKFAVKRGGILPRAISWTENERITWELALPFVMDATMPGFEPLQVLTPTLAECATDWWRASRRFFDGFANDYSPPLKKKARVSFQTHSSVKVRDRSTKCRETVERTMVENKLQKPLVVTCLTSLEEHVDELQKARQPHCVKTEMLTLSDHTEDRVGAGKVSSQSDIICFQGYKVKQSVVPILESIFNKHGDITSASVRSSFLEIVCEVASQIQTDNDIDKIEEIEKQVLVTEAANINVSWLRAHMETVHKRREASKKCSSLMEMKATTILVKKAAMLDLRESCMGLMAAQEQFKKAERCVRVLRLVEEYLDNKILESKGPHNMSLKKTNVTHLTGQD